MTGPQGACLLAPVRGGQAIWPAAVELDVQPHQPVPPIPGLTVRQEQILNYVRRYINANGYPPSFRDIMAETGLQSPSAVRYQLDELAAKGWLELPPARTARGLRLVRGGMG